MHHKPNQLCRMASAANSLAAVHTKDPAGSVEHYMLQVLVSSQELAPTGSDQGAFKIARQ